MGTYDIVEIYFWVLRREFVKKILVLLMAALLLTGCGSTKAKTSDSTADETGEYSNEIHTDLLDADNVNLIEVVDGDNGEEADLTGAANIGQILDMLAGYKEKSSESSNVNGYLYALRLYDEENQQASVLVRDGSIEIEGIIYYVGSTDDLVDQLDIVMGTLAMESEISSLDQDYGLSTMPLDMTMEVVDYKDGIVTVDIDNHSGYEMTYGDEYYLERQEGDEWISLEAVEDYSWNDAVHTIEDLQVDTVTYDLSVFGDLQPGTYRLVKTDMYAIFEVK